MPPDAPIASNAHRLALPVADIADAAGQLSRAAPVVVVLPLVHGEGMASQAEDGREHPFRDGRPVDAGRRRDGDRRRREDRAGDQVVDARGEEVDQLEARAGASACRGSVRGVCACV